MIMGRGKKLFAALGVCVIASFAVINCSSAEPSPPKIHYSALDNLFIQKYQTFARTYKVGKPYKIDGQWFFPRHQPSYNEQGVASWYGPNVGALTANGELFDQEDIAAAHPTLPLPSIVEVSNLDNGRSIVVRVNDRGPFRHDRVIDLTKGAARKLGMLQSGVANVQVKLLQEETLAYLKYEH